MEVENIPDDDVEVVGVGRSAPVQIQPAPEEEVETTEVPEEESVVVEEEEAPPTEEDTPVEEEAEDVDEPPVVPEEEIQPELAELDKLIAERKEKAEYWKEQARERRREYFQPGYTTPGETEEPVPAEESVLGPEPQQEDFESYDDYYRALARYETDQRIAYHEQQRMTQSMIQDLEIFKTSVVEAGAAKYGDFEEVARDPSLAITTQMLDVMRELEYPEDVAYYLGRNPSEAIKIARQTPARIAVSLVQLENRIQTELKTNPPEKPSSPQPRTTAPPPVKPVSGGAEQVEKDPSKMSPAEYREWRESGGGGGEYG
jgi:hypothetical protein